MAGQYFNCISLSLLPKRGCVYFCIIILYVYSTEMLEMYCMYDGLEEEWSRLLDEEKERMQANRLKDGRHVRDSSTITTAHWPRCTQTFTKNCLQHFTSLPVDVTKVVNLTNSVVSSAVLFISVSFITFPCLSLENRAASGTNRLSV